jgi:SAM-dependent methyltransferase
VDVSLAWLVTARKRLEEHGLGASLVCACAERLPLADRQFDLVAAFDTLEHVADPPAMVREAVRVARHGGRIAATTPNRFSLSAEPHVGVWGVGFLPRAWMAAYVRWRNGMAYRHTHPLSLADLGRLLGGAPECEWSVAAPAVWEGDRQAFPPAKRALAGLYNAVIEGRLGRRVIRPVAPFFEILGRKR